MRTATAYQLDSDHHDTQHTRAGGLHLAARALNEPEGEVFDPTQGSKIGSDPFDDPTQGRKIGSEPHDDPTQGSKIGSDPFDDPTQGSKIGSDPFDDPTRAR